MRNNLAIAEPVVGGISIREEDCHPYIIPHTTQSKPRTPMVIAPREFYSRLEERQIYLDQQLHYIKGERLQKIIPPHRGSKSSVGHENRQEEYEVRKILEVANPKPHPSDSEC